MALNRRNALIVVGILVVLIVIFELIPWGSLIPAFAETNPPITTQIKWDSPATEGLVRSACYDCHSNETTWPWYAHVAPISWLVAHDTNEGRGRLNFSTHSANQIEGDELIENIQNGKMPPRVYLMMHPAANLSADQKATLIAGIRASLTGGG